MRVIDTMRDKPRDGSLNPRSIKRIKEGLYKYWDITYVFEDGSFVGILEKKYIWLMANPHIDGREWPGWQLQPEELPF